MFGLARAASQLQTSWALRGARALTHDGHGLHGFTRADGKHFDGEERVPSVTIVDSTLGRSFDVKTSYDAPHNRSAEDKAVAYEANYAS